MASLSSPHHEACDLTKIVRVFGGRTRGGNWAMVIHFKWNLFSFVIAAALFTSAVDGQYDDPPPPPLPEEYEPPPPPLPEENEPPPPPLPEEYEPPPPPLPDKNEPPPPPPDEHKPPSPPSPEKGGGKTSMGTIVASVVAVVVAIPVIALIGVAVRRKYKQKLAREDQEQPGTVENHAAKAAVASAGNGTATEKTTWPTKESGRPATRRASSTSTGNTRMPRAAAAAPAKAGNGTAVGKTSAASTFGNHGASEVPRARTPKRTELLAAAFVHFTYDDILSITGNFSRVIGEGGFSTVYYGQLPENGHKVAVKKLKDSGSRFGSHLKEIKILTTIHHKNLVSFVGLCGERDELILVFEYVANGSLRGILKARAPELTWRKRLQIALDVAKGLEYLHTGCNPAVIHRDIKPANILLDENLKAKLADFGLSKAGAGDGREHSAYQTKVAGTEGYLDPDYWETHTLTKKSDVYSFGVVLFELITGKPAMMNTEMNGKQPLAAWIMPMLGRDNIERLLDPLLKGRCNVPSIWEVAEIARTATQRPSERPDMPMIVTTLEAALRMETSPADEIPISEFVTSQSSFEEIPHNPVAR